MNTAVLDAVQLALSGRAEVARRRLGELWESLPPDDFFDRCVVAHYMADLEPDADAELRWDQLALDAALAGPPAMFEAALPGVTRDAFLASLHLNLASSYQRTLALDSARRHAALALGAARSLPPTPLGETTRAAILRICASLGVQAE